MLYFLHSTSVLSFYLDVVLILSIYKYMYMYICDKLAILQYISFHSLMPFLPSPDKIDSNLFSTGSVSTYLAIASGMLIFIFLQPFLRSSSNEGHSHSACNATTFLLKSHNLHIAMPKLHCRVLDSAPIITHTTLLIHLVQCGIFAAILHQILTVIITTTLQSNLSSGNKLWVAFQQSFICCYTTCFITSFISFSSRKWLAPIHDIKTSHWATNNTSWFINSFV